MLEERNGHSACSMGNKLFVIGGYKSNSCEVLESYSRKFTYIKHVYIGLNKSICLGKKMYVHPSNRRGVFVYDTDKQKWSLEKLNLYNSTKIKWLGCVKRPNNQTDENKPTEISSEPQGIKLRIKESKYNNPTRSTDDYSEYGH